MLRPEHHAVQGRFVRLFSSASGRAVRALCHSNERLRDICQDRAAGLVTSALKPSLILWMANLPAGECGTHPNGGVRTRVLALLAVGGSEDMLS